MARDTVLAQVRERARCHIELREAVEGARRAVEAGVRAGNGSREHDEAEERRELVEAVLHHRRGEDALREARLIPGQHGDEQRNRDHIEADDAPGHVTHRNGDAFLRILALARREADDLRALEVNEDDDHRKEDTLPAHGREAAAAQKDRRAEIARIADQAEADERGHNGKGHERHDLDEREPELALAELIHVKQVDERDDEAEEHGPPELANARHEVMHDDARRDHFRRHIGDPVQPVGPADTACPCGRYMFLRIGDKRAGDRHLHRQLRQTEHHAEDDDAPQ